MCNIEFLSGVQCDAGPSYYAGEISAAHGRIFCDSFVLGGEYCGERKALQVQNAEG